MRLLDVEPVRAAIRRSTSTALVLTDRRCENGCATALDEATTRQDAILRGCDYGATLRIRTVSCPGCGATREVERSEERPPRG